MEGLKFEITPEQYKKYKEWKKKLPKYEFGAIGGGTKFSFEPTGLGVIIKVTYGKHELDLTEIDNW